MYARVTDALDTGLAGKKFAHGGKKAGFESGSVARNY